MAKLFSEVLTEYLDARAQREECERLLPSGVDDARAVEQRALEALDEFIPAKED